MQFHSVVWCTPRSSTRSRKHTTDLDSAVVCTQRSLLRKLVPLTPRYDVHRRAWLPGGMHTVELDSAVGCTPQSQTDLKMSGFCVFVLATSFSSIFYEQFVTFSNNFKLIYLGITEIALVKLPIKTETWYVIDYSVGFTPWSLTPRYDAHHGVWLRSGMHTAWVFGELFITLFRSVQHTTELNSAI